MIQDVILYVVKQLVDNPDQVTLTVKRENNKTFVEIGVNQIDRGKVIGKEGSTIKAIRTLVSALMPSDKKVLVDLAS